MGRTLQQNDLKSLDDEQWLTQDMVDALVALRGVDSSGLSLGDWVGCIRTYGQKSGEQTPGTVEADSSGVDQRRG